MKFIRQHKNPFIVLFIVFLIVTTVYADVKFSEFARLAAASGDDLLLVTDDPNGVPVTKGVGRDELILNWAGTTNVTTLGTIATGTWQGTVIDHERGGLEADVHAYGGVVGINGGSTLDVDTLAELLTAMTDVTAFITDDDMPAAGVDPDVDAAGEIGRDTDDHSLRGYDGAAQYVYGTKWKSIEFTVTEPDQLETADNLVVWTNNKPFNFILYEIQGVSDTDSSTFTLKEVDSDGQNATTIEAVTISTAGTNLYYTTVASGDIDHTTIEAGHRIIYDASAATPGYNHIALLGYYNADVP